MRRGVVFMSPPAIWEHAGALIKLDLNPDRLPTTRSPQN
jgi:hypothetical protein